MSSEQATTAGAITANGHGPAPLPLRRPEVEQTTRPLLEASMLPPSSFTDPGVMQWEVETIFSGWICAAHASAVAEPGAYVAREIGGESFFVIGGEDGAPRAFFNVCRHRGSRLLEGAGTASRLVRCPYHAWAYGFDGSLRAAPHTDGIEDFDPACNGLRPIRTAVVGGLVLVDLGDEAPDPVEQVGDLLEWLERYRVEQLRPGAEHLYEVEANWKAVAENYNECLHCPGVHPELNALSSYDSGDSFEGNGAWCGGSMTLNEGSETMGRNGGAGRPPIEGLAGDELRTVLYVSLFPNALISFHPDYVMLHTLWPKGPGQTQVTCEWLFEPATISAEGFDPSDAVEFWDQVNREDWRVCEMTQRGLASRGYTAGRYTDHEGDTHAFDRMVAERYLEAL
jgi:Rieske 2Fe-2S family protein